MWFKVGAVVVALALLVGAGAAAYRARQEEQQRYRAHQIETLCTGFTVPDARWQLREIEVGIQLHAELGRGNAVRLVQYHLSDPPEEIAPDVDRYAYTAANLRPGVDLDRYGQVRDPAAGMATDHLTGWLEKNCPSR